MPGAVRQNEFATGSGKIAIGDVDRDALLALCTEAVGQQGEIGERIPTAFTCLLHGLQLVLENGFGVVQQSADERALAVVDIAASDESKEVAARRGGRWKIGDGRWSGHGSEMGDRKRESGDRRLEVEDQGQGFLAWVEWMSPLISLPVLMERFCRWDCSSSVM